MQLLCWVSFAFEAAESGQRFATRAMICLSRGGQDAFEAGLTGHLSVIWFIETRTWVQKSKRPCLHGVALPLLHQSLCGHLLIELQGPRVRFAAQDLFTRSRRTEGYGVERKLLFHQWAIGDFTEVALLLRRLCAAWKQERDPLRALKIITTQESYFCLIPSYHAFSIDTFKHSYRLLSRILCAPEDVFLFL